MNRALQFESQLLSEELCALLRQADPIAWRDEKAAEARALAGRVAERLRVLAAATDEDEPDGRVARVRERLRGLLAAFEHAVPSRATAARAEWTAFQRQVQPAYESLALSLRAIDVPAPSLRPTNHRRSLFHVASGCVSLAAIALLPGRAWLIGVAVAFALSGWTMEILRRTSPAMNDRLMGLFKHVAHPHERFKINSSTWYATALVILAVVFPPIACALAVMILGVADPAAGLVGRRFGRTRLRTGRSLEGTLGFFVAGTLAGLATLLGCVTIAFLPALALAAIASAAGALTELYSSRFDDNFTIPVGVAIAAAVALRFIILI